MHAWVEAWLDKIAWVVATTARVSPRQALRFAQAMMQSVNQDVLTIFVAHLVVLGD